VCSGCLSTQNTTTASNEIVNGQIGLSSTLFFNDTHPGVLISARLINAENTTVLGQLTWPETCSSTGTTCAFDIQYEIWSIKRPDGEANYSSFKDRLIFKESVTFTKERPQRLLFYQNLMPTPEEPIKKLVDYDAEYAIFGTIRAPDGTIYESSSLAHFGYFPPADNFIVDSNHSTVLDIR
jgi:hypothetical protein